MILRNGFKLDVLNHVQSKVRHPNVFRMMEQPADAQKLHFLVIMELIWFEATACQIKKL